MNIIMKDCKKCMHQYVCSIKDDYENLISKIEEVEEKTQIPTAPLNGSPSFYVNVGCNHYNEKPPMGNLR